VCLTGRPGDVTDAWVKPSWLLPILLTIGKEETWIIGTLRDPQIIEGKFRVYPFDLDSQIIFESRFKAFLQGQGAHLALGMHLNSKV
ncbi:hypothetical protein OAG07_01025, partial [Verrucomicrobia bacterium]|nr:hypothetical protein [Verrucomicrobiota bacterium]